MIDDSELCGLHITPQSTYQHSKPKQVPHNTALCLLETASPGLLEIDAPSTCMQASEGQHKEDEHGEQRAKLRFEEQRPCIIVGGKGSS